MVIHKVQSPAKINLMLRILGQRADGYHNLQTLFQIIDWGDEMEFIQTAEEGNQQINIEGFPGLSQSDNLIDQAAEKLKPYAQKTSDWRIKVNKNIPQGAGLGGGSSNAAQALKFLNDHWYCGLDDKQLCDIGVQLGADVPIFISEKSALAESIGDHISAMTFDTPYILLVFPDVSVSTADMFNHHQVMKNQVELPKEYIHHQNFWINDFFPLLLSIDYEMSQLYQLLREYAPFRLSGTGSTLFSVFKTAEAAEKVQKALENIVESKVVQPKK